LNQVSLRRSKKGIHARLTGLLHRIGDCPDFINGTYSVSYGPCW
jgi:hypothetical protein